MFSGKVLILYSSNIKLAGLPYFLIYEILYFNCQNRIVKRYVSEAESSS